MFFRKKTEEEKQKGKKKNDEEEVKHMLVEGTRKNLQHLVMFISHLPYEMDPRSQRYWTKTLNKIQEPTCAFQLVLYAFLFIFLLVTKSHQHFSFSTTLN